MSRGLGKMQRHFLLALIELADEKPGDWVPTGSDRANRSFAVTTVPGHFARPGPVLVDLVRARPVPVHFSPAGCLRAHFARTGRVGAFVWAGLVPGHLLAQPVSGHLAQRGLGHLAWAARARPVPAHLRRPPQPGIDLTRLRLVAD